MTLHDYESRLRLFQHDLNQGMTINDALIKHRLNLKEAFETLQYRERGRPPKRPRREHMYIAEENGKYLIKKYAHGKNRLFGVYSSVEDAITIRDALIEDGWHVLHVDSLCEQYGVERCKPILWEGRRYS